MIMMVPIIFISVFTGKILLLLQQDYNVSMVAGRYVTYLIPGTFAFG